MSVAPIYKEKVKRGRRTVSPGSLSCDSAPALSKASPVPQLSVDTHVPFADPVTCLPFASDTAATGPGPLADPRSSPVAPPNAPD